MYVYTCRSLKFIGLVFGCVNFHWGKPKFPPPPLGGVVILVGGPNPSIPSPSVGDGVRLNQERARYAGTQSGVDFPLSGFSREKGGEGYLSFK